VLPCPQEIDIAADEGRFVPEPGHALPSFYSITMCAVLWNSWQLLAQSVQTCEFLYQEAPSKPIFPFNKHRHRKPVRSGVTPKAES